MYESFRDEAIKFRLTEPEDGGDREVLHLSALGELVIIGFITALLETVLFILLAKEIIGTSVTLLIHLGISALLIFWLLRRYHKQSGIRIALLLTITTLFLGPFGAIGTFLAVIMFALFQKTSQSFIEWYQSIFPEDVVHPTHELHLNLISGRERPEEAASVSSFIDIMTRGKTKEKQAAIQIITQNFSPSFAPALKMALKDNDPVVRVQAASAVATIERKYVNKLHELEETYKAKKDFLSTAFLADHLDEYANLGLMDPEREKENKNKALFYFLEAYKLNPNDRHVLLAIGRLLIRQGRIQEASDWFTKLIEKQIITPEIIAWMIECLYKLKSFSELRQFIRDHHDMIDKETLNENALGFVELWLAPKATLKEGM